MKIKVNAHDEVVAVEISEKELDKYIRNRMSVYMQRAIDRAMIEKYGHKPRKSQRRSYKQTDEYKAVLARKCKECNCDKAEKALAGDYKERSYFLKELAQKKGEKVWNELDRKRRWELREKYLSDFVKTHDIDKKLTEASKVYQDKLLAKIREFYKDKERVWLLREECSTDDEFVESVIASCDPAYESAGMFDWQIQNVLFERFTDIAEHPEFKNDDFSEDFFDYVIDSGYSYKIYEAVDEYIKKRINAKTMPHHLRANGCINFPV